MPATYEPIATTTLVSATATISFTSISSAYTDLRLVITGTHDTTESTVRLQYNSDTSALYSQTQLGGDGATASTSTASGLTRISCGFNTFGTTDPSLLTIDVFSYAGSTNKTCLITQSSDRNGSGRLYRSVGLYRSTSAISSIQLFFTSGNFNTGTTATLYGILKA